MRVRLDLRLPSYSLVCDQPCGLPSFTVARSTGRYTGMPASRKDTAAFAHIVHDCALDVAMVFTGCLATREMFQNDRHILTLSGSRFGECYNRGIIIAL